MFEAERVQVRETGSWGDVDLNGHVIQAQGEVRKGEALGTLYLKGQPTMVLVLLARGELPEWAQAFITQRLIKRRWAVDNIDRDFVLANQPQFVIDAVMGTELPDGYKWIPGT
jgi:hypothetical protein